MAIVRQSRYPLGAFLFVQRGLTFTVEQRDAAQRAAAEASDETSGEPAAVGGHITGRDLCHGLRAFAVQEYGLLARTVLKSWRLHDCLDFGHIVFTLVDAGLLHKTEQDTLDDFRDVYRFDDAFPTASPHAPLSC